MNKIILATVLAGIGSTAALAADIGAAAPYAKAPAMMAPVASWTGWYIGGNVGYGFMKSSDSITGANAAGAAFAVPGGVIATSIPLDSHALIGGGQFGYNWQFATSWVVGVEADIQASRERAPGAFIRTLSRASEPPRISSVRRRPALGLSRRARSPRMQSRTNQGHRSLQRRGP